MVKRALRDRPDQRGSKATAGEERRRSVPVKRGRRLAKSVGVKRFLRLVGQEQRDQRRDRRFGRGPTDKIERGVAGGGLALDFEPTGQDARLRERFKVGVGFDLDRRPAFRVDGVRVVIALKFRGVSNFFRPVVQVVSDSHFDLSRFQVEDGASVPTVRLAALSLRIPETRSDFNPRRALFSFREFPARRRAS